MSKKHYADRNLKFETLQLLQKMYSREELQHSRVAWQHLLLVPEQRHSHMLSRQ